MLSIRDQKVTIIGARKSGLALARLVSQLGGRARLSENSSEHCLLEEPRSWVLKENIDVEFNGHTKEFIQNSDILVLSPGVSIHSDLVHWAGEKSIPVLGEIEFAFQFCPVPLIAVTGSNGKTTVATLIDQVLKAANFNSILCGNVGFPFSDYVFDIRKKDFVVLEISSFQCESILDHDYRKDYPLIGLKPYIAVFLNLCQNHLDRHQDMEDYFQAKKRIFINQDQNDFAVLNDTDQFTVQLKKEIKAQIRYFNEKGLSLKSGDQNQQAVLQVAKILDIDPKICEKVFSLFKGVEHRMEWVRSFRGVDYINDSKATTADASRWALEHIEQPIVMICGGKDKNIDYSSIKDIVKQKVKSMLVIGEAKEKIKQAFCEVVAIEEYEILEQAVSRAKDLAIDGDCVVLTPMCASFDMFNNFEERGEVYKDIVKNLS